MEFFPNAAPNHVDNFINLVNSGFYDGTLFHRIYTAWLCDTGRQPQDKVHRDMEGGAAPGE
jgi:peptidyl-prolyl cis-trans isomerase B (cyclophilin B)